MDETPAPPPAPTRQQAAAFAYAVALSDLSTDLNHLAGVVHHGAVIAPAIERTRAALDQLLAIGQQLFTLHQDAVLTAQLQRVADTVALHALGDDPQLLKEACVQIGLALADERLPAWFLQRGADERGAYVLGALVGTLVAGLRWKTRVLVGLSAYVPQLTDLPEPLPTHVRAIALHDGAQLDDARTADLQAHVRAVVSWFAPV